MATARNPAAEIFRIITNTTNITVRSLKILGTCGVISIVELGTQVLKYVNI